jgi:hypothetical protein
MVLEVPDYGFIGLKLKDLIFQESGNMEARGTEYAYFRKEDGEGKWQLAVDQSGIKTMGDGWRR